jgi:hypothetical protein
VADVAALAHILPLLDRCYGNILRMCWQMNRLNQRTQDTLRTARWCYEQLAILAEVRGDKESEETSLARARELAT